ncbi:hypothetical protein ALO59_200032 [Pseudomonas amygdali pv. mellea]|nr:hypothetical protein ALO59_200032 [Pseudomonas amygdali pv. mellea]
MRQQLRAQLLSTNTQMDPSTLPLIHRLFINRLLHNLHTRNLGRKLHLTRGIVKNGADFLVFVQFLMRACYKLFLNHYRIATLVPNLQDIKYRDFGLFRTSLLDRFAFNHLQIMHNRLDSLCSLALDFARSRLDLLYFATGLGHPVLDQSLLRSSKATDEVQPQCELFNFRFLTHVRRYDWARLNDNLAERISGSA